MPATLPHRHGPVRDTAGVPVDPRIAALDAPEASTAGPSNGARANTALRRMA